MNKEAILEKMRGTSTHGNCCTCPKCKHFHDDCMCHAIARLENILSSLVSEVDMDLVDKYPVKSKIIEPISTAGQWGTDSKNPSLVSEDEGRLECGCQWLSHTEITKRLIEEYVEETLKDAEKGCPVAREFRAIFNGCIDWLDREGEE